MNKINNIKITDSILSGLLSVITTIIIYGYLYKYFTYSNLNDFYVGTSIYLDHNKYLDIFIYFIYLLIFFCTLPIVYLIREKLFGERKNKKEEESKTIQIPKFINRIKDFLLKYQILGVFGFIFLYPVNNGFYPIILVIIGILILVTTYDVYRKRTVSDNQFSPLIITAVLFAILYNAYNIAYGPTDDHHFGEKFATFLMHNNFNLEYYKDIMLVHGYVDIIPSWIGCYIFQENNIYGYCLGEIFFKNTLLILTIFSGLIIFDKNRLFIAPLLFFKGTNLTVFYITAYLLLLKEKFIEKRYIWLCIFSIISFIFCLTWTTIGSFCLIASIPILIYQIMQIYKQEDKKKVIKIIFALFPIIILMCLMHTTIFEYLKEAPEYIKGNLYAFGNTYGKLNLWLPRLIVCGYKLFALLFLPILILELIKRIKEKRILSSDYFLLFAIILPLISLNYTLGRLDTGMFFRTEFISQAYIFVVLPYFIYKFSNKKHNAFLILITIIAIILALLQIPSKFKQPQININKQNLYNVGNINLKINEQSRIQNIKDFIEQNSKNNSTLLDLTNRGMHYLYLNKKIPIKFISFYNAISTKQSNEITEKIKKNPPDIILIDSKSVMHDNIHLSLRLNSLYKWLILSGKYKVVTDKENTFLVKSEKKINYTKEDLRILDNILGYRNLNYLPEAWGNSINSLPVTEVLTNNYTYNNKDGIIINFPQEIPGTTFDLIYIKPMKNKERKQNFYVQINDSESEIYCKIKKNGEILIPFDNYPSWLLNNNIKNISIYSNKEINENYEIKFYKRKYKNDI